MDCVYPLRLPSELRAALDEIAARELTSTAAVMRRLMLVGLRTEGHDLPAGSTR